MLTVRSAVVALVAAIAALAVARRVVYPGTTAEGVATIRHILTSGGLCKDTLARHFMPARAAIMAAFPYFSVWTAMVASELQAPTGLSHLATREEWYEQQILDLMRSRPRLRQLVICGAGFDTRAYRLPLPDGVRVFELDKPSHPGVQAYKRQQLQRAGVDTTRVSFLPIDFEHEDVAEVLRQGGHDASSPTLIVWEGVTMYLPREAVRRAVRSFRRRSARGSFLLCELFDAFVLDPSAAARHPIWRRHWSAVMRSGEAFRFGLPPEEMEGFWRSLSTRVRRRYAPEEQRQAWRRMVEMASWASPIRSLWLWSASASEAPLGGAVHMFTVQLR